MTDQELRDLVGSLAIDTKSIKEAISRLAEQHEKTEATVRKVAQQVGGIGNNQGDIAEQFFYNAVNDKLELAGVHYDYADKNCSRRRNGVEDEFDIVLINGKDVAIIETKYKAHEKDLNRLLKSKKENFEKLYTEYTGYNHHYALASFYFSDDLKQRALENGIIVIERKGKTIETFVPANR